MATGERGTGCMSGNACNAEVMGGGGGSVFTEAAEAALGGAAVGDAEGELPPAREAARSMRASNAAPFDGSPKSWLAYAAGKLSYKVAA